MRVTEAALTSNLLEALRQVRNQSADALQQLADGKRVRFGSDDAFAASAAIELRARLVGIEGYRRAASVARTDLETIDASLTEAVDIMSQARALAVRGGSDSSDRDTIAIEIDALRDRLLAIANVRQNNRYLFSGTTTLTRPFEDDGVYQGNTASTSPEIDETQTVAATVDGGNAFNGGGNVFDTLQQLSDALRADDGDAVQGLVGDVEAEFDHLTGVHAEIGTRMNTVDSVIGRLDDRRFSLESRIIDLENIDIEEAATRLASAENAGQALSIAAARVLGRSLFDFLA